MNLEYFDGFLISGNFGLLIINGILLYFQQKNLKKIRIIMDELKARKKLSEMKEYVENFQENWEGKIESRKDALKFFWDSHG